MDIEAITFVKASTSSILVTKNANSDTSCKMQIINVNEKHMMVEVLKFSGQIFVILAKISLKTIVCLAPSLNTSALFSKNFNFSKKESIFKQTKILLFVLYCKLGLRVRISLTTINHRNAKRY